MPCEWSLPDEQAPRFFLEKIASRLIRRALFTNLFFTTNTCQMEVAHSFPAGYP